jgi:hypothetical protein
LNTRPQIEHLTREAAANDQPAEKGGYGQVFALPREGIDRSIMVKRTKPRSPAEAAASGTEAWVLAVLSASGMDITPQLNHVFVTEDSLEGDTFNIAMARGSLGSLNRFAKRVGARPRLLGACLGCSAVVLFSTAAAH